MMRRTITLCALAVAAAATTLAAPAAAGASTGGAAAMTVPMRVRAGLTLHVPAAWSVYRRGDWLRVVTGACAHPERGFFEPNCDSFWVLGPKAIKYGHELFSPYTPDQPFYPATDVEPCPVSRRLSGVLGKATAIGLKQVGPGHKANYRSWPGRCVTSKGEQKDTYTQREWYLPKSKILVVDQHGTPELAGILKNATWS
ncbi:hypothetical protein [Sphaerisporangium fuscum]|uniref:hypothetical protein n=1 Tax=Sphaerisporangium fuscum TaxID=2835868 RepID=UPI001BDCA198|nr:hypothetical protein [Sphaerisporangium fuscum]